uniref:hypothetical protein n=1 Tax=uncultured Gimesia sp. TaxID=1678688 RepID=UPI00262B2D47
DSSLDRFLAQPKWEISVYSSEIFSVRNKQCAKNASRARRVKTHNGIRSEGVKMEFSAPENLEECRFRKT